MLSMAYKGQGLSPRVRGNLLRRAGRRVGAGSIPACAGEPGGFDGGSDMHRVYPRVCGGTAYQLVKTAAAAGLSPRVRGNLLARDRLLGLARSIPACAGEPRRHSAATAAAGVYPRVCGGTGLSLRISGRRRGLSPRVRGNRRGGGILARFSGSIPACAGEPISQARGRYPRGVYPRVCGGTRQERLKPVPEMGLSPRVRGNPQPVPQPGKQLRSIPACAGEPHSG